MTTSNTIRPVADFDGWYPQSLDGVCKPGADACNQRNGFIDSQLFKDSLQVCFGKIGGRHLLGGGVDVVGLDKEGWGLYSTQPAK